MGVVRQCFKKLGKIDKAREAFLRRDELRRDEFILEKITDDVEDEDLDYLSSQQRAFTHEYYVYGMEEDVSSGPQAHSVSSSSKSGSVLPRKNTHTEASKQGSESWKSNTNGRADADETDRPDKSLLVSDENSELRDRGHSDSAVVIAEAKQSNVVPSYDNVFAHDSEAPSGPNRLEEPITDVDEVINEELIAEIFESHDGDFFDFEAVESKSSPPELNPFLDDVYAFDPDEFIEQNDFEEEFFTDDERITIIQRAERLAAEFIDKHDWHNNTLDLLTHIFAVKTYGPVVKFLNQYAEMGMQPDELRLAYTLREIWHQLPKYWLSFHRNGDSAASYCNFSWSQSLRFVALIARRQHGALDEDILVENLDRMYERWFSSRFLRESYKSFSIYLNATMDQIEEDEVLIENESGFGCLDDSRELAYSDLGETDLFDYQLEKELESYGYSYDRSTYRTMRFCEEIIYDDVFFNRHRLILADASNKD